MLDVENISPEAALALLAWQVEMGVCDALGEVPVNRFELAAKTPTPQASPVVPVKIPEIDPVSLATEAARAAGDLEALRNAMASFEHCELRKGARNLVFSDGDPAAKVMLIGEAPGREEDIQGKPFVGQAGQLLDRMFAAIDMDRTREGAQSFYIVNVLPWRPPQNRDPKANEVAMMLPFLTRHVELIDPDVIVLMGNHACKAALGKTGITRMRGAWTEAFGRPALPMLHPAYLVRQPLAKREAWADLLSLKARLMT